jgi:hypothetical protein
MAVRDASATAKGSSSSAATVSLGITCKPLLITRGPQVCLWVPCVYGPQVRECVPCVYVPQVRG